MKRNIALVFCALCAYAAFAVQLDHWVYDSSAKTISDNVWTISVSRWASKGVTYSQVDSPVAGGYPTDPACRNARKRPLVTIETSLPGLQVIVK